jgi:hypothetical protein
VDVLFGRETACVREQPHARRQAELAPQGGRAALRRERIGVDTERPRDDAPDAPVAKLLAHECTGRHDQIAAPIELARVRAHRGARQRSEPARRHLHDVAMAKRDERNVEAAGGMECRPGFGAGVADFDQVGRARPNLARPAPRGQRPAMAMGTQRPRPQIDFAVGAAGVRGTRDEQRMPDRRMSLQPTPLRPQVAHHAAAGWRIQHRHVEQVHPSIR